MIGKPRLYLLTRKKSWLSRQSTLIDTDSDSEFEDVSILSLELDQKSKNVPGITKKVLSKERWLFLKRLIEGIYVCVETYGTLSPTLSLFEGLLNIT